MKGGVLEATLHIDHPEHWDRVYSLLKASDGDGAGDQADLTSEYYINLITKILKRCRELVPRDSKLVQTDPDYSREEVEDLLKRIEEDNWAILDYNFKLENFHEFYSADEPVPKIALNCNINDIDSLLLRVDGTLFKRLVRGLVERELLLERVIERQHRLMENFRTQNHQLKSELTDQICKKGGPGWDAQNMLEKELLKTENERLSLRLDLYKSELTRIHNNTQSSSLI